MAVTDKRDKIDRLREGEIERRREGERDKIDRLREGERERGGERKRERERD